VPVSLTTKLRLTTKLTLKDFFWKHLAMASPYLLDSTDTPIVVKGSGVSSASTDSSLVVHLSPNQPNLTTPLAVTSTSVNVPTTGGTGYSPKVTVFSAQTTPVNIKATAGNVYGWRL
jgi:hypothetical protein